VDLLASTVGFEGIGRSRLRVVANLPAGGDLRLVVQVFGRHGGWPLGAAERVVSAAELRLGVDIQVLHEGVEASGKVLAWLEPNVGELEFGALTAVPVSALALAQAPARNGSQLLVLDAPDLPRVAA
jgi:hypothetical protein